MINPRTGKQILVDQHGAASSNLSPRIKKKIGSGNPRALSARGGVAARTDGERGFEAEATSRYL